MSCMYIQTFVLLLICCFLFNSFLVPSVCVILDCFRLLQSQLNKYIIQIHEHVQIQTHWLTGMNIDWLTVCLI